MTPRKVPVNWDDLATCGPARSDGPLRRPRCGRRLACGGGDRRRASSKHSGVIALFQRHFVRPGLVTRDVAQALPRAFEKRQKTDYGDFATIEPDEARQIRA